MEEFSQNLDNPDILRYLAQFHFSFCGQLLPFLILKIELEEKAYRERLEKIKKLEQEIDEYMFLVPKKLEEIVEEGKNLNHCVGSYVEKHKTGETTIIFMRKKESQDQSLYTIEYKNKHIVQIQGYKNKEVIPEKVREVANKWVKKIS